MKRRDFLAATGVAGLSATMLSSLSAAEGSGSKSEFIELRTYTVKDEAKKALLIETLDKSFIPAANAQGIKPVGVLVPIPTEKDFEKNVFVVIPHKNIDSFLELTPKLLADEKYRSSAFFSTTSKDPVYTDCEVALLKGFEHCPKLETPELGPDRVYHLRRYRSFNSERNAAKVHMFDHGGEMELFRELGILPIFFGDALTGVKLPNLTYMVAGKSVDQHNQDWKTFASHPKWQEIKKNPAYADTATEIIKVLLKPSAGSQF